MSTKAEVDVFLGEILGNVNPGNTVVVTVSVDKGHDTYSRTGHTQRVSLSVVSRDEDGRLTDVRTTRIWLPVHPESNWDEGDMELFTPAYMALVEAVDEWLRGRGLPSLDPLGNMAVRTPPIPAGLLNV